MTNRALNEPVFDQNDLVIACDDFAIPQARISSALAGVFRDKDCDAILANRKATIFEKNDVISDRGEGDRPFFFLLSGFVKVGTITPDAVTSYFTAQK